MQMLAGAFAGVADGTPGMLLLGGEAGAGKSRLVAEFTAQVRGRALVLAGGCIDLGRTGLPYAPFMAALLELVRQRGAGEVAALLPGNGQAELARLLPQLGSPAARGDPETARGRLFGSLLLLLEQLAGERPLVLIIEDVHWADRSTADLLAFLVRALQHGPVLLVVTFRSEELSGIPALRRLIGELGRMDGVMRLELPRLSREEVAAQLEGILGRPPEPAVADTVYQRGGGNPLFTEALLGPEGTVSPGLPWSLRELLFSMVRELPEQAQQMLRAAAVGGTRARHGVLAAMTGQGDAALDAALRPAVAAGVLVETRMVVTRSGTSCSARHCWRICPGRADPGTPSFRRGSAGRPGTQPWSHSVGPAGGALARRGRARRALPAWTAAAARRGSRLCRAAPDAGTGDGAMGEVARRGRSRWCRSSLCGRDGGGCRAPGWRA